MSSKEFPPELHVCYSKLMMRRNLITATVAFLMIVGSLFFGPVGYIIAGLLVLILVGLIPKIIIGTKIPLLTISNEGIIVRGSKLKKWEDLLEVSVFVSGYGNRTSQLKIVWMEHEKFDSCFFETHSTSITIEELETAVNFYREKHEELNEHRAP